MVKFGYAKSTLRPVNGTKYEGRLFPSRSTEPPEAVLEFSVCRLNNEEDEIDVGPVTWGRVLNCELFLTDFSSRFTRRQSGGFTRRYFGGLFLLNSLLHPA